MNLHSVAFLQQTSTVSIVFILLLFKCAYMTLTLNSSPLPFPFLQREVGREDEQKGGGKVKWTLVTYNKLIVIYEVFKYLSSIDEELVMPMLQDLDQEPRLP